MFYLRNFLVIISYLIDFFSNFAADNQDLFNDEKITFFNHFGH